MGVDAAEEAGGTRAELFGAHPLLVGESVKDRFGQTAIDRFFMLSNVPNMKALKRLLCAMAVLAAVLVSTINSPAPVFMKFDGVDGEANAPGVTNAVELLSFSVGHSRSNSTASPVLKELVIVKTLDKSSPKLAEACAAGNHIPQGIITCRKAGGSTNDYYTITLQDCFITSYSVSGGSGTGGGESLPTESISLNYTQIEWKYQKQDAAGQPLEPPVIGRWPAGPGTP
jgi:type VI secretion system Hcp family effector